MGFLYSKPLVPDRETEAKTLFFNFYKGRMDHLRIVEEWEGCGSNFKTFHMDINEYTGVDLANSMGILLCSFSFSPIDDKLYIRNFIMNTDLKQHMKILAMGCFSAYLQNLHGYSKVIFLDFKAVPSMGPTDYKNLSFHKIKNTDTLNELLGEADNLEDYNFYVRDYNI